MEGLDPATREGRRPAGLCAGLKGNEAVAPPCFGIGIAMEIVTEGLRPAGLCAGLKGNEAVAPPRRCR